MALAVIISAAMLLIFAASWLLELTLWALGGVVFVLVRTSLVLLWLGWAALNPKAAGADWAKAEQLRKAGLLAGSRLTARP